MNRTTYWLANWRLLILIFGALFLLNLATGRYPEFLRDSTQEQVE